MLLPPGRASRLLAAVLRITVSDDGYPGRGRLGRRGVAQAAQSPSARLRTVSSLALKPTMDRWNWPRKSHQYPDRRRAVPGAARQRSTAVKSRCPADNDLGRPTAVIRRRRPAGPYMACRSSGCRTWVQQNHAAAAQSARRTNEVPVDRRSADPQSFGDRRHWVLPRAVHLLGHL
jgi:hypothetical protein